MKGFIDYCRHHWLFLIGVLLILFPILLFAGHSVAAADDFASSLTMRMMRDEYSNSLTAAFAQTAELYKTVGGYYFAAFANYFSVPFLRGGMPALRAYNVVTNLCFFLSAWLLVRSVSKHLLKTKGSYAEIVFLSFMFIMINGWMNREAYTWYCVQAAYVIPLITIMLALALMIKDEDEPRAWSLILAAVISFLASGSSLNVAALSCGLIFLAAAYYLAEKGIHIRPFIVFAAAMAGAVINVAAPGNYIRHGEAVTGGSVAEALRMTAVFAAKAIKHKIFHTEFPVIFLIVLLATYLLADYGRSGLRFSFPVVIAGLITAFAGIVIVDFPVILGYEGDGLPGRCILVQDLGIYALAFIWTLYFAGWLRKSFGRVRISKTALVAFSVGFVALAGIIFLLNDGTDGMPTAYMYRTILNGNLRECAEYQEGILEEIEASADSDVVVHRGKAPKNKLFFTSGLSDDKTWWVNVVVATYYGKDSVTFVKE